MSDYLSREAQRSRQTAMEAERHWWVQRVEGVRRRVQHCADSLNTIDVLMELNSVADELRRLIAERTK